MSDTDSPRQDRAPGDAPDAGAVAHGARTYWAGYALAMLLTAASFAIVAFDLVWPPAVPAAIAALAVAQMGIHLVFFLHMTSGPDNVNNALALAFGVLVTMLVVIGSMWIMAHLDHRVMPMADMMARMR